MGEEFEKQNLRHEKERSFGKDGAGSNWRERANRVWKMVKQTGQVEKEIFKGGLRLGGEGLTI